MVANDSVTVLPVTMPLALAFAIVEFVTMTLPPVVTPSVHPEIVD